MALDHQPWDAAALAAETMRQEIADGLSRSQAMISPKYFYDELGSKLFEAICCLDEYYLTRCEDAIFAQFRNEISHAAGTGTSIIDLGAGNCRKAAKLFGSLRPQQYVPVDISATFLHEAVAALQAEHPDIAMHPVAMDFSERLHLPAQVHPHLRLFFYPGSSLGNLTPLQALQFLQRIRHACNGPEDAVLIGIDLVKDSARLEAAYDDAVGVTAAFNRNVLLHVNTILGADFKPRDWRHRAVFNREQSRIEMHLHARWPVTVQWPGGAREFAADEYIHTENSYKYTRERFLELLSQAGFGEAQCWTDAENSFLVSYARAL